MTTLYLIQPHEHGNGGWHGSSVLAEVPIEWMLARDPVELFLDGDYDPMFGSQLRLCKTKNPNNPLYLWDHEEKIWLNGSGYPLNKV